MNLFAIVRTSMAVASLTLVATPIHAQSTPATLANDVLAAYQKGNADEFANLVTASSLLDNTTTLSAQIKTNIETLLDIYGPVEGWELVKKKSASERYVENTYLIFQNEFATRLELTFYQRSSGWIIVGFQIDDKIVNLLEETD